MAAGVPEDLRHKVGGVHARAFGVEAADLALVVVDELDGLTLEVTERRWLRKRRHLEAQILLLREVEASELGRVSVVDDGGEQRVDVAGWNPCAPGLAAARPLPLGVSHQYPLIPRLQFLNSPCYTSLARPSPARA